MFFSYLNHNYGVGDNHNYGVGDLPRWLVFQAENATEANEKLVSLVGLANVTTPARLSSFDPYRTHCNGTDKPRLGIFDFVDGINELLANELRAFGHISFRVQYTDGTIVRGTL